MQAELVGCQRKRREPGQTEDAAQDNRNRTRRWNRHYDCRTGGE